jgi:hypothetical protein
MPINHNNTERAALVSRSDKSVSDLRAQYKLEGLSYGY